MSARGRSILKRALAAKSGHAQGVPIDRLSQEFVKEANAILGVKSIEFVDPDTGAGHRYDEGDDGIVRRVES